MNIMQQPGPDLPYGTCHQRPRAQMLKLFLVFTYIWQEDVAKIPNVPGAREIAWLVGVTIYCSIFSIGTIYLLLANFYATNYF